MLSTTTTTACEELTGGGEQPGTQTTVHTIEVTRYCVSEAREGAAGSTYTTYTYRFPYLEKSATFSFTLRAPQCANYPTAEQRACREEIDTFNLDGLIEQIRLTM